MKCLECQELLQRRLDGGHLVLLAITPRPVLRQIETAFPFFLTTLPKTSGRS